MFHHIYLSPQVKEAGLLVINMVSKSCLTSCRTIEDFRKLGNYKISTKSQNFKELKPIAPLYSQNK